MAPSADDFSAYPPARTGWYAATILSIGYLISIIDRQILSLFLVPIQNTLQVSDTAMGFMHGFSFAIFYALMGLPISRLIDAGHRPRIIAAGIALWSIATAASGLADAYWQLLVARVFVGIGEATLLPGAVSLIADYFTADRRGRAMGLVATGAGLGNGASMLAGAAVAAMLGAGVYHFPLVGQLETWQIAFIVIGLPGVLAALLMLTVREPGRRDQRRASSVPIREVFAYLRLHRRTYTGLLLGSVCYFAGFIAFMAWTPTLFMRAFNLSPTQTGLLFGVTMLILSSTGSMCGGWLADYWVKRGYLNGKLRVNVVAAAGMLLFGATFPLCSDLRIFMAGLIPCAFFTGLLLGTAPACIQDVTPGPMRGQITALYTGLLNIIGFGAGPFAVGLLTDYVFRDPLKVGYSLSIVIGLAGLTSTCVYAWGLAPYLETQAIRAADEPTGHSPPEPPS
jgi:MFS family permease